jgi:hypothetical protein
MQALCQRVKRTPDAAIAGQFGGLVRRHPGNGIEESRKWDSVNDGPATQRCSGALPARCICMHQHGSDCTMIAPRVFMVDAMHPNAILRAAHG